MQWIMANWMQLAIALLAIDRVLITLFPSVTVFGAIKTFLEGLGAK